MVPRSPWQDGFIESLATELGETPLLGKHQYRAETKYLVEDGKVIYNQELPHVFLNPVTPIVAGINGRKSINRYSVITGLLIGIQPGPEDAE